MFRLSRATIAMTAWSCILVLGLGALLQTDLPLFDTKTIGPDGKPVKNSPFDVLTSFVIFGSVTFETAAVATIFVFRRRIPITPENRPYRCWGYPFVPALYIAIMGLVLFNFFLNPESRTEAFVGMGFIATGALAYLTFFRGRAA